MNDINKGPLDYHHILKRRRITLERWAENEGIRTAEDFIAFKCSAEKDGYFLSEEMLNFGNSLTEPTPIPEPSAVAPDAGEDAGVTELPRVSKVKRPKSTTDPTT